MEGAHVAMAPLDSQSLLQTRGLRPGPFRNDLANQSTLLSSSHRRCFARETAQRHATEQQLRPALTVCDHLWPSLALHGQATFFRCD